ncbi:hypothetical protein BDW75DRAFT_127545 [Aspergillus navahoensis]
MGGVSAEWSPTLSTTSGNLPSECAKTLLLSSGNRERLDNTMEESINQHRILGHRNYAKRHVPKLRKVECHWRNKNQEYDKSPVTLLNGKEKRCVWGKCMIMRRPSILKSVFPSRRHDLELLLSGMVSLILLRGREDQTWAVPFFDTYKETG